MRQEQPYNRLSSTLPISSGVGGRADSAAKLTARDLTCFLPVRKDSPPFAL